VNRIVAGLVVMGMIAGNMDSWSASATGSKTDPTLLWPKNSRFTCRGVLADEQGTYRLTPDQGMLAWCDADIDDKDKNRVSNACKLGDHCEIRGTIMGHGAFAWVEITSVMTLAHVTRLPEAYLGDWSSDDMGGIEVTGIGITQSSYHEPGYNCDIRSIQPKNEASTGSPVYLVDMRCSMDGEGSGPPQSVREVWALRKANNNDMLVIAGVGGATFPSIHLLHRPKP
jgi:hypothetical protein